MSNQSVDFVRTESVAGDAVVAAAPTPDAANAIAVNEDDFALLAAADREHLEREIAAIERAAAALRRAEPGLESWADLPAQPAHKPRPIWLLIGFLWVSTALVTIGAIFAVSALMG